MKKILSVLLTLTMILSVCPCAFSVFADDDEGGYGSNYGIVEDSLSDEDIEPDFVQAYNDFETVSKTDFGQFKIIDTDPSVDPGHGKVMKINNYDNWASITSTNGNTYSWNGKTPYLFHEEAEKGKKYIFYYEYKNIDHTHSGSGVFSFAPELTPWESGGGPQRLSASADR